MPGKTDPRRPNAVDVAVGRNVRMWRLAKGLSQAVLAKRVGVTFQQVQKYETGGNRITTGRLVKIAGVLGVPLSALLHGVDAKDPSQSLTALISDSRSFRLAHAFAAVKNSQFRDSLVNMVEQLAALPQKPKRRRR
jgi:transcriptional regulator with XRE-family HTH domain